MSGGRVGTAVRVAAMAGRQGRSASSAPNHHPPESARRPATAARFERQRTYPMRAPRCSVPTLVCDTHGVQDEPVRQLPVGCHLVVDERGVGMRATWRLDRGFVNVSLWKDDSCVETFHLDPGAAADLIGFLVQGLADATTRGAMAPIRAIGLAEPSHRNNVALTVRSAVRWMRAGVAADLAALASRIHPS